MKPWVSLFYCHPWDQVILWNSFQKSYLKSYVKLKTKQLHKKLVLSHSITTDHWRHTGFPRALKCYFEKWKVLTLERKHKKTEKPDPVRISVKRDGRRQPEAWRAEQGDTVCHGVPGWAVHLSKATEAEKDHSHPGVLSKTSTQQPALERRTDNYLSLDALGSKDVLASLTHLSFVLHWK